MIKAVAAIGDAGDINCWSGTPYHFATACGSSVTPWQLDLDRFKTGRRLWNLRRLLSGHGVGGYQYSESFLDAAEAAIPETQWQGFILTFNQHFPRGRSVAALGGRLVHYIDATFASFCRPGGLAAKLPVKVRENACALERENYASSEWVVTMARWAAESAVRDCGVASTKVSTILPGANLTLPAGFMFPDLAEIPPADRPLRLGFVGKDWVRKGLSFLLEVRAELERMEMPAVVRCAGNCPEELAGEPGLEYVGFIDKAREPERFLEFLTSCDLGCLFSASEPLGISTLEFLRAGVPVAGFMVEGVADTVPPDAGFRFAPKASAIEVALALRSAFRDPEIIHLLRTGAQAWSPLVTWERCVREWRELLTTGTIKHPVQPWRGLDPVMASVQSAAAEPMPAGGAKS
jgi:glycosyltransferase involved in cell wall biosynthesis